jgi:type IV secretory pathway component VirB8
MNQGETGIDCGGPCKSCPIEMPNKIRITIFYLFFFIVLLLIILIVFLLKNIQEKKY